MTAREAASEMLLLLCSELHSWFHQVFHKLWFCQSGKRKKVLENICCRESWFQMKFIRVWKCSLPGNCLVNISSFNFQFSFKDFKNSSNTTISSAGSKTLLTIPTCLCKPAVFGTLVGAPQLVALCIPDVWPFSVGCGCVVQLHNNVLLMPILGNLDKSAWTFHARNNTAIASSWTNWCADSSQENYHLKS